MHEDGIGGRRGASVKREGHHACIRTSVSILIEFTPTSANSVRGYECELQHADTHSSDVSSKALPTFPRGGLWCPFCVHVITDEFRFYFSSFTTSSFKFNISSRQWYKIRIRFHFFLETPQISVCLHNAQLQNDFFNFKFWVRKHPKPKIVESRMKPISIQ